MTVVYEATGTVRTYGNFSASTVCTLPKRFPVDFLPAYAWGSLGAMVLKYDG